VKTKLMCVVTARSIVGKRGKVYDVNAKAFDTEFHVTGNDRKAVIAEITRDVEYVRLEQAYTHENGFALFPQGFESWVLKFAHGGSYCFRAANLPHAVDRLCAEYAEHEEIQAFLRDAICVDAPEYFKAENARRIAARRV